MYYFPYIQGTPRLYYIYKRLARPKFLAFFTLLISQHFSHLIVLGNSILNNYQINSTIILILYIVIVFDGHPAPWFPVV